MSHTMIHVMNDDSYDEAYYESREPVTSDNHTGQSHHKDWPKLIAHTSFLGVLQMYLCYKSGQYLAQSVIMKILQQAMAKCMKSCKSGPFCIFIILAIGIFYNCVWPTFLVMFLFMLKVNHYFCHNLASSFLAQSLHFILTNCQLPNPHWSWLTVSWDL